MRVQNWPVLLTEHIEQAKNAEFVWGQNDCALWCADWVLKATKRDFASQWRGRYESEEELNALLAAMDIAGPECLPDAVEMRQHQMVTLAQRGDIVLIEQGCLGICNGIDSYFLMERGVTRFRTEKCVRSWKVE